MMKHFIGIILGAWISTTSLFAQETSSTNSRSDWKESGSPIITVFSNFHNGLGKHNDYSGFELNRAYLGYQFEVSPTLSGRVVADVAVLSSDGKSPTTFLKNAFLRWEDQGFTVHAGLISLTQFQLQERFWGHRYILQSYQDLYKMGPSADLGITGQYQFAPWISADVSLFNGEGYKRINQDNNYRYSVGTTIKPTKELTFRLYADQYNSDTESGKNQQTYSFFGRYKCSAFSLGTEYNYQANNKFARGNDYYGYSIYTDVPLNARWTLFGRYDQVDSKNTPGNDWFTDGHQLIIGGIEYKPIKQLRFAPNYQYVVKNKADSPQHEIYLNVEFAW